MAATEEASARGCYLTFDVASNGTLFLNWSDEPVEGALAFVKPGKKVPGFKFKQHGGKSELVREMSGGTGERIKRYYGGMCSFFKLAQQYEGTLEIFAIPEALKQITVHTFDGEKIDEVPIGEGVAYDTSAAVAVACLPKGNNAYAGVDKITANYFVLTGNREGASLQLVA